jgi:hypothetical protein
MSTLQFSRWIALVGVLAGMMIALIVPVAVLMVGGDLTPSAKLIIIILALLIGGCVAAAAAVVGITIPTAVVGGAIDVSKLTGASCCGPAASTDDCCSGSASKQTPSD